MAAFVLGNGISRQAVDLYRVEQRGPIYGCNALYRTYVPHVLVATDAPIARSIQESGYSKDRRFYTRRPLPKLGALPVPKEYFGFSSGPIAVAIAAMEHHSPIYLLGFDMGPTGTGEFNNIYAGTEFYKPTNANPTFTGNWIRQMVKVVQDHPKQRFVRVHGQTTARIQELEGLKNLEFVMMDDFLMRINNGKEL
jgi:hypothetical protein